MSLECLLRELSLSKKASETCFRCVDAEFIISNAIIFKFESEGMSEYAETGYSEFRIAKTKQHMKAAPQIGSGLYISSRIITIEKKVIFLAVESIGVCNFKHGNSKLLCRPRHRTGQIDKTIDYKNNNTLIFAELKITNR